MSLVAALKTRFLVQLGLPRVLQATLVVSLAVLLITSVLVVRRADRTGRQLAATGQALMQSQRLAKSVSLALVGRPQAFPEVRESAAIVASHVAALQAGDSELGIPALGGSVADRIEPLVPLAERTRRNAEQLLAQEAVLTQAGAALRTINR